MHVGLVAPPWIPVPPPAYGGTEAVIGALVKGLVARGVEVTLFAHPESTAACALAAAELPPEHVHMGDAMSELAWAAAAHEALADCDVVHHHTMASVLCGPARSTAVLTNHGPFEPRFAPLFQLAARKARVVAISESHAATSPVPVTVIHHGVDVDEFPVGDGGGGYLMFLGRLDPSKGADTAIEVARRSGRRLVIAAKMRDPHEHAFYEQAIAPHLGEAVTFVREPDRGAMLELLAGAIALVNPIAWREPFGLVMVEAQACGTPVLTFGVGAAPELVIHGRTGFVSASADEMVADVVRVAQIPRDAVREHVAASFSADRMVERHLALYRELAPRRPVLPPPRAAAS